jgi:hypothetical protein
MTDVWGTSAASPTFHQSERVPGTAANDPRPIPNLRRGRDQWRSVRAASTDVTDQRGHAAGAVPITNGGASTATHWEAHRVQVVEPAQLTSATANISAVVGATFTTRAGGSTATRSRRCGNVQRAASKDAGDRRKHSVGVACTPHAGANMATRLQMCGLGVSTRRPARLTVAVASQEPSDYAKGTIRPTSVDRDDVGRQGHTRSQSGKRNSRSTTDSASTAVTKRTRGITSYRSAKAEAIPSTTSCRRAAPAMQAKATGSTGKGRSQHA